MFRHSKTGLTKNHYSTFKQKSFMSHHHHHSDHSNNNSGGHQEQGSGGSQSTRPQNVYSMIKGTLKFAAPYEDEYHSNPHYIITVADDANNLYNIVVNSSSSAPAPDGSKEVYFLIDQHFVDPINDKLKALSTGAHTTDFPKLDYWRDSSLLNIRRMSAVPYESEDGSRFDINDDINEVLTIDESQSSVSRPFFNGKTTQQRKFWVPTNPNVTVYGFGFLFPTKDGLHETHMNQGNPVSGGHAGENGTYQDGAVIVQIGDNFSALFTAFQTQYLPTDATGTPVKNAKSIPEYVAG